MIVKKGSHAPLSHDFWGEEQQPYTQTKLYTDLQRQSALTCTSTSSKTVTSKL